LLIIYDLAKIIRSKITNISTQKKSKSAKQLEVAPTVSHFKHHCNRSQEQLPVAEAIRLTCWSRLWYSIFPHVISFFRPSSLFDLRRASSIAGTATCYGQSTFIEAY